MVKRAVSLVTILALLASTWSCVVQSRVPTTPQTLSQRRDTAFRVKAILTTARDRIEFRTAGRAKYVDDLITVTRLSQTVTIAQADVASSGDAGNSGDQSWILKNGWTWTGRLEEQKDRRITLKASGFAIQASDVDTVLVEETDGGKTFLVSLAITAAVIGGLYLIALLTKESCPFVYSFDGSGYVLDAEPYGGATCPALKRTEWSELRHAKDTGGEFRFKMTNEVDETQYTDELKLVVVDHPATARVIPDERGTLRTVATLLPPTKAIDGRGRDILSYVKDADWVYWQTPADGLDPRLPSGTKEALLFEFPKPRGAHRAKLVFDGGNTLWASQMVKRFLSLHGRDLDRYYTSLATPGPSLFALAALNQREELYRLNLRVSTAAGWVSKGMAVGGGPFVTRPKIYSLDIADVPGDTLTIQLTPPVGFWMINQVAVDYSEDEPFDAKEIEAVRAVDSHGTDVRSLLASSDGRYLAMPDTGDSADLVFLAPPPPRPGLERTVILKAAGYYDIHMGTLGDPQPDTLAKIRGEPGFAVRFAMEEFARWRAEQRAAAGR